MRILLVAGDHRPMGPPAVRAFMEAAVSSAPSFQTWLSGLARAAAPVFEAAGGVGSTASSVRCTGDAAQIESATEGVGDPNIEAIARAKPALESHSAFFRQAHRPFRVTILSRQFGRSSMTGHPIWEEVYGDLGGFRDALGIMGPDGPVIVSTLVPTRGLKRKMFAELREMQRSLALTAAARLTLAGPDDADAVLDPSGRVVHMKSARIESARELLRAGVRAMERVRLTGDSMEGEALWSELLVGKWSVVENVDADGKRYLLIRKGTQSGDCLTTPELRLVELAATAASNKKIALELGVSESTVSERLGTALSKLGFRSRIEFLRAVPRRRARIRRA